MMRQLSLGIVGAAALGAASLMTAPAAQAQSWSLSIETGHGGGYASPVRDGWGGHGGYGHGRWHGGRDWGRERGWDRGWHGGNGHGWRGRPVYGGGYGGFRPRCHVRKVRYWDGWSWVVGHRQVCG
ncbi:MAG: hypothetical protein HEQ16_03470 [Bosea sp.]|nr:hypothetical protein [Bosea sp. (in: a-proteobacteria)]